MVGMDQGAAGEMRGDEGADGGSFEGAGASSSSSSLSGSSASPSPDSALVPAEGSGETAARRGIAIVAGEGELRLGDVDLSAARSVLASLGADGAESLAHLSTSDTIELLAGLNGISAAIAAVQARALLRLETATKEDCLARGAKPRVALRTARAEAAFALHAAPAAAGQSMSSSRRLVQSMPGMLSALAGGKVSPAAAHRVGRVVGPASPRLRTQVDDVLTEHLPYLEGCGVQEWGSEAEKIMQTLDPDGAAARHVRATQSRGVTVRRSENGMSRVTATLTALDGARIRKGLSLAAEKARAHGDRRGHSQIMADLFADTLIGRGTGDAPTTMEIGVIITDRSLFAPAHADPAVIEGLGPVPYEHIREEMRCAMGTGDDDPDLRLALRNLYIDPEDGQLVAVESRSRAFPPALSRFLRWSHLTCRAPYCDAPIRQNDHITPYAEGGSTSVDNGNGLCALDNQKEEAGVRARVVRDADGTRRSVEWTTRYGQKARRRSTNFDPVGTAWRTLRGRNPHADQGTGTSPSRNDDVEQRDVEQRPVAEVPTHDGDVLEGWTARILDDVARKWEREAPEPSSHASTHRGLHRIALAGFTAHHRRDSLNRQRLTLQARCDYVFDAAAALEAGRWRSVDG